MAGKYKYNPLVRYGFDLAGGAGSVPFYANSVWTSFQRDAKTPANVNLGSNSAYAVGINIKAKTRIKNARIYISTFVGNNAAEFALYKVENGIATTQIFREAFNMTAGGAYTFAVNLDLEPGNYAYATNHSLITGFLCINNTDNVFGVNPAMGTTMYPLAKQATVLSTPLLPDPFPVGQVDYSLTSVPLAIFEIEMI